MKLQALRKPHVAAAASYLVAGAAFVVQMGGMSLRSLLVPLICVGIMVAAAVSSFKIRDNSLDDLTTNAKEIITLLATVVYVALIYVVGFYPASFVYAMFVFVHVSGFTRRTGVIATINACGVIFAVYAIFNLFLDYFVPGGMLGDYLM